MEDISRQISTLNIQCDHLTVVTTLDGRQFSTKLSLFISRLPAFAVMLEQQAMRSPGRLEVDDISGEVMAVLLQFIHCGNIGQMNSRLIPGVIRAGIKYKIKPLLEECMDWILAEHRRFPA